MKAVRVSVGGGGRAGLRVHTQYGTQPRPHNTRPPWLFRCVPYSTLHPPPPPPPHTQTHLHEAVAAVGHALPIAVRPIDVSVRV